ncbi:MAG: NBR1-Ig-like domain-containing protein [Anaerolineales bacterium]
MKNLSPSAQRVMVLCALALAACAGNPPTSVMTPLPVIDTATPVEAATASPAPPTFTALPPTPTQTQAPIPTLTSTPKGPCVNDAEFVEDVSVPDGAQFLPGQTFVKKWRVRNIGTCDWGLDYRLVLIEGEAMTALPGLTPQIEFALYPARAGTLAVFEIPMRAPDVPGTYNGRWQPRDPAGLAFGAVVFVTIEVIPLPTQSP